jgi:hypothetical protein
VGRYDFELCKKINGRSTERVGYENIRFQIQKQILKRRYNGEKQNKLYESPPKFSRSVVRYVNLTSEDTKNVILLKKKRL